MPESRPEWAACKQIDTSRPYDPEYIWWAGKVPFPRAMCEGVDMELLNRKLSDLLTTNADRLLEESRRHV